MVIVTYNLKKASVSHRKTLALPTAFLAAWLGVKYLLPLALPFLLGGLLALAAEPVVRLGTKRLRLPRGLAAGMGVSLTLVFLAGILSLLGALAVKELGVLAGALPEAEQSLRQGMAAARDGLIRLSQGLPDGMGRLVRQNASELFGNGTVLLQQVTDRIPGVITSLVGGVPAGALGLGTGVLTGFMVSARLPRLRQSLAGRIPQSWKEKYLPALGRVKSYVWQWAKAQGKLMAVTYGILALGLTVTGVKYGFFWGILIALVNAVPILGTGTVLVPWAAVVLLRGQVLRGVGLLGTYLAAMLTRTVLEPRLVGKHLGLDPLVTLVFLYVGYRVWGFGGMILAPMLAAATKGIIEN